MAGALGFVTGLINTFRYIEGVKPDERWVWMLGAGESLNCIALALVLTVLAALAASAGAFRLARSSAQARAETT